MSDKPKSKNIGAIWVKQSQRGDEMLSIKFDEGVVIKAGEWYTAMRNQYKEEGDKRPDYNIMPPRDHQPQQQQRPASRREAEPEHPATSRQQRGYTDEEVPF